MRGGRVMSELRRLRRERIFAASGPKGRKLPAGVPFGEFPAGPAYYFGLDFPVRKSVHAGAGGQLVPLAVSPRINCARAVAATNEEEPQWARAPTGR